VNNQPCQARVSLAGIHETIKRYDYLAGGFPPKTRGNDEMRRDFPIACRFRVGMVESSSFTPS